ncbi:hypothetical protein EHS25_003271 [Saitozyma podzolica]|uniref:Uncharacterized protein n=1 Tax=Saitozyma podzolica TaxID=1890683 RepID=A0A427Y8B2_9TREE|nr:hypothetical protein EHS25_003271 [Saitozyma podzolica]
MAASRPTTALDPQSGGSQPPDRPSRDTFLDTDDEIHVIAGALWTLSVKYDKVDEKDRPKDVDGLRKWITKHRIEAVGKLANKVEPPFTAWSIDQMQKDVGAMMEELLSKTLPPPEEGKKGKEKDKKE